MIFPAITALAAGVLIILQMALSFHVINGRVKYKVSLGDNGEEELERRIRAHGNLTENAAIVLVCLGLIELSGFSPAVVIFFAIWFVLARLAHFYGLVAGKGFKLTGANTARFFGAASTMFSGIFMGLLLIYIAVTKF